MLTDDLQGDDCLVLKVVHLHTHFVLSRVLSVGGTDEQDAVSICAADVHPLSVQGLPILQPAHNGFGFALSHTYPEDSEWDDNSHHTFKTYVEFSFG